jgi:hypothetical protein
MNKQKRETSPKVQVPAPKMKFGRRKNPFPNPPQPEKKNKYENIYKDILEIMKQYNVK